MINVFLQGILSPPALKGGQELCEVTLGQEGGS